MKNVTVNALFVIIAIIVGVVLMSLTNDDSYALEHTAYYYIYVLIAGVIYLTWLNPSQSAFENAKQGIQFKHALPILVVIFAGYYLQKLPDIDNKIELFGSHRSPITHSIIFIWLAWYLLRKKRSLLTNKWVKSLYLALTLGIAIHLLVDSAYLFGISLTPMLDDHKGHGWISTIPTFLEIPFLMFMMLTGLLYSLHLLKGEIRTELDFNVWKSFSLLRTNLSKGEKIFFTVFAGLILTNLFDLEYNSDSIWEGFWSIVLSGLILGMIYFKKDSVESLTDGKTAESTPTSTS